MKNNIFLFVAIAIACTFFAGGCGSDSEKENAYYETAIIGKLTVLVDSAFIDLIEPTLPMYHKAFPQAVITVRYVSAKEAMDSLLAGNTRCIVLGRGYLKREDSLMAAFKVPKHQNHTIATDALVFVVHKRFSLDTLSKEQIQGVLTGTIALKDAHANLKTEPKWYVAGVRSSEYANLSIEVLGNAAFPTNVTLLPTSNDVIAKVKSDSTAIGITYLSRVHSDESVKLLRVGFADTTGKRVYPQTVHQSYVALGMYPFPVQIRGYMLQDIRNLPWGFLTHLSKDGKIQEYFKNSGIVPAYAKIVLVEQE